MVVCPMFDACWSESAAVRVSSVCVSSDLDGLLILEDIGVLTCSVVGVVTPLAIVTVQCVCAFRAAVAAVSVSVVLATP